MEISKKHTEELKKITRSYHKIHNEYSSLEAQLMLMLTRKDKMSKDLTNLRELEISVINKIESETGKKVTHDDLVKILEL